VPNVVNQVEADANSTITAAGLVVGIISYEYSDSVTATFVMSQAPLGGTTVPIGSFVDLVVSLGQPTPSVLGAYRLVELQNNDGGWDWQLDDGDPNSGSDPETFASVAMGLAQAYRQSRQTSNPDMLAALQKAKTFLLTKTDDFEVTDGALAVELDDILGGTACVDYVSSNFYDKLEAGTYYDARTGATHDTGSLVQALRILRADNEMANFAARDLGLGLYSAYIIGASTTDWVDGLKAEIDELDPNDWYDVLGLAGAVFGLAAAGEDYDPQAGAHAAASSLSDLAETLAGYQLESGGFTWHGEYMVEGYETPQETAYGILALNEVNRPAYLTEIYRALTYVESVQLVTGGWEYYTMAGEKNEITGGALQGISVALAQSVVVPYVIDQTEIDANSTITATGLTLGIVTYDYSDTVAAGLVITQDPVAGTETPTGLAVDLVVSLGMAVVVPDVVGETEPNANSAIASVGLIIGTVSYESNDTVAAGLVISQNPAGGTTVPIGSFIDLVVSAVAVPNVALSTEADANSIITGAGLTVGIITYGYSETVTAGFVISQNPAADTQVPIGSSVDMVVSLGPSTTVPNIVGMTQANASSTITGASLVVGAVTYEYDETVEAGAVISQTPTAGTTVGVGIAVDLVISLGQPINAMLLGGNRLVELQNNDGGWDWPLSADGDPNSGSDPERFASVAMGLAKAYGKTSDPNMLAALQKAKTFLLNKADDFVGTDGAFAVELDSILGGTDCVDYVSINFYDKLEAGTYYDARSDAVHDTNSYVQALRSLRDVGGIANFAAWDLGLGLYSAYIIGANTTDWLAGLKAEIDELDGMDWYDVLGLAGAVFGLAAVGEDYDPQAGWHSISSSLDDLAETLAAYQLESGGFTWSGWSMEEGDETLQETVYALMALSEVDRPRYLTEIHRALIYLQTVQLVTGGWKNNTGTATSEDNQITGEALRGIAVAISVLGDFDKDGNVNFVDFAIFASAWLTEPGEAKWNPECDISDLSYDIIDEVDLAEFTKHWLEVIIP
jgi:beta-lactam-binding protein with PASTA domain